MAASRGVVRPVERPYRVVRHLTVTAHRLTDYFVPVDRLRYGGPYFNAPENRVAQVEHEGNVERLERLVELDARCAFQELDRFPVDLVRHVHVAAHESGGGGTRGLVLHYLHAMDAGPAAIVLFVPFCFEGGLSRN